VKGDALYHEEILRLARRPPGAPLPAPDGRAVLDNPLCGDEVAVELTVRDGRILAVSHRVRGCALCQASAAVLAAAAPGCDRAGLRAARDELDAMLRGGPAPAGAFEPLAVFRPVGAVKSRHACVLLPFEAIEEAMKAAG
jgi:nitrogen fixation protein NifU and related proteins